MTELLEPPVATDRHGLPEAPSDPASDPRSVLPVHWFLGAMLLGAGAVHLAMAPAHFGESTVLGTGFVISAWVQIALAGLVVWRPSRWVLGAAALTNAVLIALWAVGRTAGLPLGGEAGQPEAVAFVDGACVALEAIAAVLAVGLIVRPPKRAIAGGLSFIAAFGALALTTAAIASPSAQDHMDHASPAGHGAGTPAAASGSSTGMSGSMAGMDMSGSGGATELNGQHVDGVKAQDIAAEAQPDKPLDPTTRATLQQQLVEARAEAMRYPTVSDAIAAGYRLAGGFAPGSGAHYISYTGLTVPGAAFDPSRPLALIYSGTSPTSQVIGLMYYAMSAQPPEGFAGPNDHWHRHSNICINFGPGGIQVPYPADADVTPAQCASVHGFLMKRTGWMVHAWVVPSWESPQGVFSHDNPDVRCADGTYKTNTAGFCQGT